VKAYTTRVGEGPYPTEIHGDLAEELREEGAEYGTTTGRPRRIGWLDIPALQYVTRCDHAMKRFAVCFNGTSQRGTTRRPPPPHWLARHSRPAAHHQVGGGRLRRQSDFEFGCNFGYAATLQGLDTIVAAEAALPATVGFCQLHCECDIQLLRISVGS